MTPGSGEPIDESPPPDAVDAAPRAVSPRVRRIRIAFALFGLVIAVATLLQMKPEDWRAYVVFTPLVVLSYFFTLPLPPPVHVMLFPYLSIMSAFVYIAGVPMIGLDWVVRIVVYPIVFALARRGLIEVPFFMNASYETFTKRKPLWNDEMIDEWAVVTVGAMGFVGRALTFQVLTGPLVGMNPIFAVLLGELVGFATVVIVQIVLPLPYSDMLVQATVRTYFHPQSLDPRPDTMIAVVLCQPSLVLLMYYGFQRHGIDGAAALSVSTLGPHYLLRLMNRHFTALEVQHAALERASAGLQEANRELEEKADALQQKQEELRDFVYTVTHDLKNPLGAIQITADILRETDGASLTGEGREHLERIARLAGSTEDMIRDLMEFFKITSAPEPARWIELKDLVGKALDTFQPQLSTKGVHVEVAELPPVWGQFAKLGHVITNLVSNAIKYVPPGAGRIRIIGEVDDDNVRLCVGDNGIGIPVAYQRGIFELFGRVPAKEQQVGGDSVAGTGVGLAVVKRIVEGHRGRVWVESEPGAGARFWVELPAGES